MDTVRTCCNNHVPNLYRGEACKSFSAVSHAFISHMNIVIVFSFLEIGFKLTRGHANSNYEINVVLFLTSANILDN